MHHKFTKHGRGSCRKAVNYLLQEHDHKGDERPVIRVLRGNPDMVADVADSITNTQKYTSGIIAWAQEERPTEDEIQAVLADWERLAFAGIEPENRCYTAVLHGEIDGGVHIHTITARVELSTGNALNIAPPNHQKAFDAFRDSWNFEKGWARPDDPDRQRISQDDPGEKHRPGNKAAINEYLFKMVELGHIQNADDVYKEIAKIGEITRRGSNYISVKPHGEDKAVRLKGGMFTDGWTAERELNREARLAAKTGNGRGGKVDQQRAKTARRQLRAAIQRRAGYNAKRFKQPEYRSSQAQTASEKPEHRAQQRKIASLAQRPQPSESIARINSDNDNRPRSLADLATSGANLDHLAARPFARTNRSGGAKHWRQNLPKTQQPEPADQRQRNDVRGNHTEQLLRSKHDGIGAEAAGLSGRASKAIQRLRAQAERIRTAFNQRIERAKEHFNSAREANVRHGEALRQSSANDARRDQKFKGAHRGSGDKHITPDEQFRYQVGRLNQVAVRLEQKAAELDQAKVKQEAQPKPKGDFGPRM